MTPNGVADDYVLQLRSPGGVSSNHDDVTCHLAIGGARCALPNVLPAWHPLSGTSTGLGAENLTAARLTLGGSVAELRTRAHRLRDVPMVEITLADMIKGGETREGSQADAAPKEEGSVQRFRCGLPVEPIKEAELMHGEASRLQQLQQACPAFFAPRGTRRRQLDWLHRRRTIPDSSCK